MNQKAINPSLEEASYKTLNPTPDGRHIAAPSFSVDSRFAVPSPWGENFPKPNSRFEPTERTYWISSLSFFGGEGWGRPFHNQVHGEPRRFFTAHWDHEPWERRRLAGELGGSEAQKLAG
jgi:hypothetical protein